jgi:hypothetical protein
MQTTVGFVQAFLTLSLVITLARLSTDTGGGDYFFTLIAVVVAGSAAPYFLALKAMARLKPRRAWATGVATTIFGVLDTSVRTQAFFFPTERSGGGMALWLPLYAILLIPLLSVIVHTGAQVAGGDRGISGGAEDPPYS